MVKSVILWLLCLSLLLTSCDKSNSTSRQSIETSTTTGSQTSQKTTATQVPLSPARSLVGTWETPFAVKFYIQTDFRNLNGQLEDAPSLDRTMKWIITSTGNENQVTIECYATDSNIRQVAADPPIAYTPDVFPIGFTGTVSSSRLVTPMGEFDFTNDIITGTWEQRDELLYVQREFTQTKTLILTRIGSKVTITPQTIIPTTMNPITITPTTITPTTIIQNTITPFNTAFASLLVSQVEYNRLVEVFNGWGFSFDTLYPQYSDQGFTQNWASFWIGSTTDESLRVVFDKVGNQWKPRAIS